MRKFMALFLAILMVSPGAVLAQTQAGNTPTPAISKAKNKEKKHAHTNPKFTPIDVNQYSFDYYDADTGWSIATATSYSYKGINPFGPEGFRAGDLSLERPGGE